MNIKATENQKLASIILYYANSNCYISQGNHAALLDLASGQVIGFPHDKRPYHPVGGFMATDSIVKSGFVPGSDLKGFRVRHCYDNVYMLAK